MRLHRCRTCSNGSGSLRSNPTIANAFCETFARRTRLRGRRLRSSGGARRPVPRAGQAGRGDAALELVGRLAVLRRRDVVAEADRALGVDAVVGVSVDRHQVERVDAGLLVRVAAGDPRRRLRARGAGARRRASPGGSSGPRTRSRPTGRSRAPRSSRARTATRRRSGCGRRRPARAGGPARSRGGSR